MGRKQKAYIKTGSITGRKTFIFFCEGCGCYHNPCIDLGETSMKNPPVPVWEWNGDLLYPTLTPSVLCFPNDPAVRCHLWIKNGNLEYLSDCFHSLKGQTVEMSDES